MKNLFCLTLFGNFLYFRSENYFYVANWENSDCWGGKCRLYSL